MDSRVVITPREHGVLGVSLKFTHDIFNYMLYGPFVGFIRLLVQIFSSTFV
jgi:hypothetical protein